MPPFLYFNTQFGTGNHYRYRYNAGIRYLMKCTLWYSNCMAPHTLGYALDIRKCILQDGDCISGDFRALSTLFVEESIEENII